MDTDGARGKPHPPGVLWPAVVLGFGLGGFVDGIVLHQILRWHHLLSSTDATLTANIVADGVFHAGAWVATLGGLLWLWVDVRARRVDRRWPALIGGLLLGWGAFNLAEGLINHQLLGIHHVRPGPHELAYDLGFLALGALQIAAGRLISRRAGRRTPAPTPATSAPDRAPSR